MQGGVPPGSYQSASSEGPLKGPSRTSEKKNPGTFCFIETFVVLVASLTESLKLSILQGSSNITQFMVILRGPFPMGFSCMKFGLVSYFMTPDSSTLKKDSKSSVGPLALHTCWQATRGVTGHWRGMLGGSGEVTRGVRSCVW